MVGSIRGVRRSSECERGSLGQVESSERRKGREFNTSFDSVESLPMTP